MGIANKIINLVFSNSSIFDRFRNLIHDSYKNEKNLISRSFRSDLRTLDFGCGIGQFSSLFHGNKYYGVDVDNKYIGFCKLNRKGNFLAIKTLPPYKFNKGYFDQIMVSAVVHHINDKKLALISKEFKRILKKDGKLMVIDHFTKENQDNLFCKFLISLDRGEHFRNPEGIIALFSKSFKVKKKKVFGNGPYKDYMLIFEKIWQ